MTDMVAAIGDLLGMIPVVARRALYGLFALVVVLDGIWNLVPEGIDDKVLATFGVFNSVMALANSRATPLPPPPPRLGVVEQYPGEFA
jgi:hypothetical protein